MPNSTPNRGEKVFEKLEEIESVALRTRHLTQQLLTFSKGGEPVKGIVSIAGLLREAALFTLRGSNVRCVFDLPDNLWSAAADGGQIGQVINNIIINAEQAMPAGGVVEVSARNVEIVPPSPIPLGPGKYVEIAIRDEGIGISKIHLAKIFDPYFTTKQKGSGIGLAVAYSIVDKHNGYITAESEGAGTTFHVYLPATEATSSGQTDPTGRLIRGAGKILLMDDEPDIRTVGSEMLKALGYAVTCVCDGTEAVDAYRQALDAGETFDALILDLTIPGGMGGKDAVAEILALDPSAVAIVSSGYSNDPVIAQFRQYGFRGAVCKPYRLQDLSTLLHEVLAGKSSD